MKYLARRYACRKVTFPPPEKNPLLKKKEPPTSLQYYFTHFNGMGACQDKEINFVPFVYKLNVSTFAKCSHTHPTAIDSPESPHIRAGANGSFSA